MGPNIRKVLTAAAHSTSPIFVAGCSHSGTSLVREMLGMHSRIHALPNETGLFCETHLGIPPRAREEKIRIMKSWDVETLRKGKARWLEKTPNHLFFIREIMDYQPSAQWIILIRDGRDVSASLKLREHVFGPWENNFAGAVQKWIDTIHVCLDVVHEKHFFYLRYEEIILDAAAAMKKTVAFLGEDFEPAMLRYYENKPLVEKGFPEGRDNSQYRRWQMTQPIFDARGGWKQQLNDAEKQYFKQAAGNLLIRLGYEKDFEW